MDHFDQNEAELRAQFGEAGPVAMAQTWMHLLLVAASWAAAVNDSPGGGHES